MNKRIIVFNDTFKMNKKQTDICFGSDDYLDIAKEILKKRDITLGYLDTKVCKEPITLLWRNKIFKKYLKSYKDGVNKPYGTTVKFEKYDDKKYEDMFMYMDVYLKLPKDTTVKKLLTELHKLIGNNDECGYFCGLKYRDNIYVVDWTT